MKNALRKTCRNLLTVTGTWGIASRIRRSRFANIVRSAIYRDGIHENNEGKIVFPHVDIYLTESCNLKCEHCSLFNPLRSGIVPKEELLASMEGWSKRINPKTVLLLGGEPLLHPDYEEITLAARNAWRDSEVFLITNGLLLPKVGNEFLERMAANRIGFHISRHLNTDNFNNQLDAAVVRFKRFGVKYEIIEAHKSWVTCQTFDENGIPCSANSDPRKAWTACLSKYCHAIHRDSMCRCSVILNMVMALEKGELPKSEFGDVGKHRLVSYNDSTEDILKYLRGGVMSECRFCPEEFTSIEARQIPADRVRAIREIIAQKNGEFLKIGDSKPLDDKAKVAG